MTTLAKRIKRARKTIGITQVALAERAGTTQSIVGQLEAGMLRSSKAVPGIAKALDVSAGYLQYGDENKAAPAREALRKLCEEQQAKIEALLADNATLAKAKGKLAEELKSKTICWENQKAAIIRYQEDMPKLAQENANLRSDLEALRDENIALVKEAMDKAETVSVKGDHFSNLVNDLQALSRLSRITNSKGVELNTLDALIQHHLA